MSTHEIQCPHCHETFALTDAEYLDIVGQVKNAAFEKELHERVEAAKKLVEKDAELAQKASEQDAAKEITKLKAELTAAKDATKAAVENAEIKAKAELAELKGKLDNADTAKELAISVAVSAAEKTANTTIVELKEKLSKDEQRAALQKESLEAEIARLKDHRISLTTQGIGAEFEKWCENEFNKLRAGAFRNSYFERDNEVKDGGKGDYIFRESSTSGTEILSIMFEMKNQADESVNTKKNSDFFDKLNKDRVKKGCEYAILVTTLEPENDLYNTGIVDMSHVHDKMFVIRPQFFISLIIILRNAALASLEYKDQVALMKAQSVDVTNFEAELDKFKAAFGKNFRLAGSFLDDSIKRLDKSITELENAKKALEDAKRNFGLANDKAQDISIKKLTKGNDTMKALFDSAAKNAPIEGEEVEEDE